MPANVLLFSLSFVVLAILVFAHFTRAQFQVNNPFFFNLSRFGDVRTQSPVPPGQSNNVFGLTSAIDQFTYTNINWNNVDRRAEEGWWNLYPFGERYFDIDMGVRPWLDLQIDLDFFFPFYGFRFNYSFIFPEGFVAFSFPRFIQPPYTFPTPQWPHLPDPSFIAAYMSPQTFMHIGETRISHVWYRIVQRPTTLIGARERNPANDYRDHDRTLFKLPDGQPSFRAYRDEVLKIDDGRVEDPEILNLISDDIHNGMVGMRGFTADYALIVTWERMGYGGAPKWTKLDEFEQFKRWQNTYQLVICTDEIRSVAMFNYANVNWTSSTEAGTFRGRGGKQSALVGFNGGNGTGFYELPYSAEGNSYKLVQYGSTPTAGRWLARIDEEIRYGGCTNTSTGLLRPHTRHFNMIGGFALNVSGPCFRDGDIPKLQIDIATVDCRIINMVIARCVLPVDNILTTGITTIKLSVDGGKEYNYWNNVYLLTPARPKFNLDLITDPDKPDDHWHQLTTTNLTFRWQQQNLTYDPNQNVDVTVWGYWEDLVRHRMEQIGTVARNIPNSGRYYFNPQLLDLEDAIEDAWQYYTFGMLQVRVVGNLMDTSGDGVYWSTPIPLGWYFNRKWTEEHGEDWPMQKCQEWFEYDGQRDNFVMQLEPTLACPCTLSQANLDIGRFMPLYDCDALGDGFCYYTSGAGHCVTSATAVWNGASQQCCYDNNGWLMFSQDFEYNTDWLTFYSAGTAQRGHVFGSFPYRRPPFIPTLSNYFNDRMPYQLCCLWAEHCELFYWRRETSTCQGYKPPSAGFAYGDPHFITYDGTKYTFNGKGYYVLTALESPAHNLMVQVRMEEPPATIWSSQVRAACITGLAASDNGSSVVQVYARGEFRRWRYRMDVYVDGIRVFFDRVFKNYQQFTGVSLFSPARNTDTSDIRIMFDTGVGIRVQESRGLLDVMVVLPPNYAQTDVKPFGFNHESNVGTGQPGRCEGYFRTYGLLGTYNHDDSDDLETPECQTIYASAKPNAANAEQIFKQFGQRWRVDGVHFPVLFDEHFKPLYNPLNFADEQLKWLPIFDPKIIPLGDANFIYTLPEVEVACQGVHSCVYDYLVTGRREIALDTLNIEKKDLALKQSGEQELPSCGPLQRNEGVIKFPPGNNYLDGVTVTFTCQPAFFLHGDQQRICVNGTWTPGWWTWCRSRTEENALKWITGLLVTFLLVGVISCILGWCYCLNVKGRRKIFRRRLPSDPPYRPSFLTNTSKHVANPSNSPSEPREIKSTEEPAPATSRPRSSSTERQPSSAGYPNDPNGRSHPRTFRFTETST